MKKDASLLRIFIGEDDEYKGKKLYLYILDYLREKKVAGATVIRGIAGFGKSSHIHTTSILSLSDDLPIIIEVVDKTEVINKIADEISGFVKSGMITSEHINLVFYEGK